VHDAGVLPGRGLDQHRLQAAGLGLRPEGYSSDTHSPPLKPGRSNASIGFQACEAEKESAMSGIGRKIIYVMLVIVVLLIIWQFLGSL
jgi:hypothetical protein